MKRERSEIRLLLGLLLVFSTLIGVLHGRVVEQEQENTVSNRDDQDKILERILPFIQSQSIETTVAALRDVPLEPTKALLIKIIDSQLLETDDIMLIVGGVSTYYPQPNDKATLFSLLLEKPIFQKGLSPLYTVANSIYASQTLPFLFAWIKQQQDSHKKKNQWLADSYKNALEQLLAKHNVRVLEQLDAHTIKLSTDQLSNLLWLAAANIQNSEIVRFLLEKKAPANSSHEGLTPLMKAVLGINLPAIKLLVQAGADVNTIIKPEIGSALQLLVDMEQKVENKEQFKKLLDIEDYLREHGARELV